MLHYKPSIPVAPAYSVEVDDVGDGMWDEIAGTFLDVNPEQTACYSRNHWKGRDSHLLLRWKGEPVAGARVAVVGLPLVGRGLALVRFGPFWRKRETSEAPDVYAAIIEALVAEYCNKRGHCLTVLPRPHPEYEERECAELRGLGFTQRRAFPDPERFFVNTRLSDGEQTASLAKQWRYNLKQSLAKPLSFRFTEDPAEIDAFEKLYLGMKERKQFSSTTPVHITHKLMTELPPVLRPRLAIAEHEGRFVAGATVGSFGDTAYYMFGATAAEALPLNAGYALQWWVWRHLRDEGIEWYDLGGAAEAGLRSFKKGFVGKAGRITVIAGEFDRWTSASAKLAADGVFRLRDLKRQLRHGRDLKELAAAAKAMFRAGEPPDGRSDARG